MNDQEYRNLPGYVYSTFLKEIYAKSDKHAGLQKASTPAMEFGTAAHMYFLEPEKFAEEYTIMPTFKPLSDKNKEKYILLQVNGVIQEVCPNYNRTAEFKEQKAAFIETSPNYLTEAQMSQLTQMKDAVMKGSNEHFHKYLQGGTAEMTIVAEDFRTIYSDLLIRTKVKARLDYVIEIGDVVYVVDLKTTDSAAPRDFASTVRRYGYDIQAAFYADVACQYFKGKEVRFLWLAVEKEYPYGYGWYQMSKETYQYGFNKYASVIERATDVMNGEDTIGYNASTKVELL